MRLFVAIELSEAVRANLVALQKSLARTCDGVRWIPGEQLHLTVKFLGDVEDDRVPEIREAIGLGAAQSSPFDFEVKGCGCFPPRGAVRIVWAGCEDSGGGLFECVNGVCMALEAIGFPPEDRPFSPHITVGRVKEDRSGGEIRRAVSTGILSATTQRVESVALMSSVLSSKGPTYAAVHRVKLV